MSVAPDTAWSRFRDDLTPVVAIAMLVLAGYVFIALFGRVLAPYGEAEILTNQSFAPPSSEMWLGSDYLGRDLFSRILYGTRVTLFVALAITVVSFSLGVLAGFLSAAMGGRTDMAISRFNDALLSFPALMLALIVISSLGSSILVLVITVALIDSTRVFRVARALAADIVVLDYVEAAQARGEGLWWIIRHEVAPNTIVPLAAEFGIRFTYAILFISALSFLGLGVQPPQADLGVMVRENMQSLLFGTFTTLYPALSIAAITVSVNLIVDWVLSRNAPPLPRAF